MTIVSKFICVMTARVITNTTAKITTGSAWEGEGFGQVGRRGGGVVWGRW